MLQLAAVLLRREATHQRQLVLQGGHAVSILVERVRKPTDNRSAQMFRCLAADADSLRAIGWSLAPAHPPYPSRAGANGCFDEQRAASDAPSSK